MKRITVAVLTITIFLIGVASGQEKKNSTQTVVLIPSDIVSPLVAYQPDCPLKIEEVKLLQFVNGGTSHFVKFRNAGTKPIRSYTIGWLNSVGTGGENGPIPSYLLPGDVFTPGGNEVEVVPLTKELRDQLKLNGEMQAIVVFVVIRVEFADGSTYDGEPFYKALKAHLDKISL